MAKGNRVVKRTDVHGTHGNGVSFEHQESFDDNLLPDANELEKLQLLDPKIMEWIKDTTSREQIARHNFNSRKIGLFESAQRKSFLMNILQSTYAFLIIVASMFFSYFLIDKGHIISGSIFAGGTVLFAVYAFLNKGKTGQPDENKSKKEL
jgi:uncharacterized membrane protein